MPTDEQLNQAVQAGLSAKIVQEIGQAHFNRMMNEARAEVAERAMRDAQGQLTELTKVQSEPAPPLVEAPISEEAK